jgi:RNA polymerase sigma factor (sigma-70 family)
MHSQEIIPHLFRTEYSKIVAVLCRYFGFEHIETAEDIVSDTFLEAAETWGLKVIPDNPAAWLYAVAKNKAKNQLQRNLIFEKKIAPGIKSNAVNFEVEIDLSDKNIFDSQLQMMFTICNPVISTEAQIGLALRILCGFGIEEIADAFLSNKETINKRLSRAKEKLREENIKIEMPVLTQIGQRLENVLTTLYLLFSEGYYSQSKNTVLRKDLCFEAMRLAHLLTQNKQTAQPHVSALLSLMCFQASRFNARITPNGESVLYEDQDTALWDEALIVKGRQYLIEASAVENKLSRYHLEAAIAYRHTSKDDSMEKWEHILQLHNRLLQLEYSPIAALNRTYALSKVYGKEKAIIEAEKLALTNSHFYYSLLGYLYTNIDNSIAVQHFNNALELAKMPGDKKVILDKIAGLTEKE